MLRMSVTLSVLKPLTSMLVRLLQPLNMLRMSVTLSVLKPLTSRLVRLEQPKNMPLMSVTLSVLRFSMPEMVVRLVHPRNQ